jgi:hypothetical protein
MARKRKMYCILVGKPEGELQISSPQGSKYFPENLPSRWYVIYVLTPKIGPRGS